MLLPRLSRAALPRIDYVFNNRPRERKNRRDQKHAKELEKAITPKTKAIFLNTPCNPTGAVYTEEESVLSLWDTFPPVPQTTLEALWVCQTKMC